jgi:hypothetical protein
MESPNAPHLPDPASLLLLARGLENLRDSLVEFSLFLEDCQSELDTPERTQAQEQVTQTLHRLGQKVD